MANTGWYLVIEHPPKGARRVLSSHRSLKAAFAKRDKLRRKAGDAGQFTVNHELAYSIMPGDIIENPEQTP